MIAGLGSDATFHVHAFKLPRTKHRYGHRHGHRYGGQGGRSSARASGHNDMGGAADDVDAADEIYQRVRSGVDELTSLPLDLAAAREAIGGARLDVLVFTDIGLDVFSYYLAFARLAPVQCSFVFGHPVTSGLPTIDYAISSADFEGGAVAGRAQRRFTERLVLLQGTLVMFARPEWPRRQPETTASGGDGNGGGGGGGDDDNNGGDSDHQDIGSAATTPLPSSATTGRIGRIGRRRDRYAHGQATRRWRHDLGLDPDATVYVCPQSLFKIHPSMDALLLEVLRRDDQGVLVLVDSAARRWRVPFLRRWRSSGWPAPWLPAAEEGQASEGGGGGGRARRRRVVVLESLPFDAFMRLLTVSDVMLDSSPMSGGVTSFEALHVGLPIVAAPPLSANSTCFTKAMYKRMGITDILARDGGDFVATAVRLGQDPHRRALLRERIMEATEARRGSRARSSSRSSRVEDSGLGGASGASGGQKHASGRGNLYDDSGALEEWKRVLRSVAQGRSARRPN